MKNILKSVIFVIIFIILYISFSYLILPKTNLKKFGLYKTSLYEILGEEPNTIDTIILGDSLAYSSVSPMEIYGDYGFTVFDCAEPAQILPDAYEYFKMSVESQHPKIAMIEADMFFRDASKKPWYNKYLKMIKNSMPLITYHNNWKNFFGINGWINVYKGYKKNTNIKPSRNFNYMKESLKEKKLPESNYEYFEKFVKYAKDNNVKLILIGFPSQKAWNDAKHKQITKLSSQYNLTYINLNLNNNLDIDWKHDTKDHGNHLNFFGAKKISKYIGNYLNELNMLENHKNNLDYYEWDKAYEYYQND